MSPARALSASSKSSVVTRRSRRSRISLRFTTGQPASNERQARNTSARERRGGVTTDIASGDPRTDRTHRVPVGQSLRGLASGMRVALHLDRAHEARSDRQESVRRRRSRTPSRFPKTRPRRCQPAPTESRSSRSRPKLRGREGFGRRTLAHRQRGTFKPFWN